jgi:hypothetical protein
MKLQVTKQTTEEVDIEVPSFYRRFGALIAITETAAISIYDDSFFTVLAEDKKQYSEKAIEATKSQKITGAEFMAACNKTQNRIKELVDSINIEELEGTGAVAD